MWVDGRVVSRSDPVLRADDGAFAHGLGCYTTARFRCGEVLYGTRAARRLVRDVASLGLGSLDEARAQDGLVALGLACFGERGEGVVRLQASCDGAGALHLTGVARELGPEPAAWSAVTADFPHPGPGPHGGAKISGRTAFTLLGQSARRSGADESLLFDAQGRLVEGTRTNLVVVHGDRCATPPLARGPVAGVAREILMERGALVEADLSRSDVASADELVALNSVRGARPIVRLDGSPVAGGEPGPRAARLDALLAEEAGRGGEERLG